MLPEDPRRFEPALSSLRNGSAGCETGPCLVRGWEAAIDPNPTLVGREREIALLREAVDHAASGRARSVLLAGEPGIGKSALADEAAVYATKSGALTLWGSCWEGEGAPAFWPWVQIIRAYAAGRRTDDLYAAMGDGAADIARLVPEVGGRFLSLSPADETGPDQARFRLFDHVARFLRAAAETQPLLLVFDDLHWADRESLTLLRFFITATRDARVLVLGTYRDVELSADNALRDAIADLGADRLALRGLNRDDVGALIRATTGTEPAAGLTEAIFGKTTGNPLFVKEVARLLAAQGRLEGSPASAYAIPEGVRDVVRRRLAHLDQGAVELLGAASVLGPEFAIDALGALIERPVAFVADLLAEPQAARIVAEVPETVGRYAFTHALVRDVVYEDLGPATRAGLHWRAGELLEQKLGGEAKASEIAHHLVNGATRGDPERAADAAIRAGRIALRMYAWDRAADLYTRALDALELGNAAM
ncbi:MAG: AAA family ATPase, partial [Actinomycetota bacterium]